MKRLSLLCICVVCLILQFSLRAQSVPSSSLKPLGEILNSDGTVNLETGFQGSVDPSGWKMKKDKDGKPKFYKKESTTPAQKNATTGDEHWDNQFGSAGLNGTVCASASTGSDLYMGGSFTTAGGASANYIARWNGSTWSALGSGLNNTVYAIAISGSDVYVGGGFTTAGGASANYIAKWNGSSWSALGSGLNAAVYTIAINGSDVYAGGHFTTAGGASANYIAKWDGSSWSALGSGLNDEVKDIEISGSDVYACGAFTIAGGTSANHIAKWNGTAWSSLGSGYFEELYAIAIDGSDIYTSGYSYYGIDVHKWNGTAWSSLDDTYFDPYREVWVNDISIIEGNIYIGGWFATPNGRGSISVWTGTEWSHLDNGIEGEVHTITAFNGDIYAGGWFEDAGGIGARYLAKYNGSQWSSLGTQNAPAGNVYTMAFDGSYVYAGGSFESAGGVTVNNIARWNGTTWSSLGSGTNGRVYSIAVSGTDVYIGGSFTTAGGLSSNYISKWNGSTWSALGSGLNGMARTIAIIGTDVYVGGDFTNSGGVSANYVAKWNGSSWSPLGSGVSSSYYPSVKSIATNGTDLFVGGIFTTAGGLSVQNVARWDGTQWHDMAGGVGDAINAVASNNSHVYVAGGGSYPPTVHQWNGSTWSEIGDITGSYMVEFGAEPEEETMYFPEVFAMVLDGNNLYVGGLFPNANGLTANGIARWDGSSWSVLGSGLNGFDFGEYYPPYVFAVMVTSNYIYAGGDFVTAGNKSSFHIGRYSKSGLEPPVTTLYSHYTKVTSGSIVTDGGASMGCAWGDYDNDTYPDLFVANDGRANNFLYQNKGDGSFTKITTGPVVTDGGRSFAGTWGDYDNDGDIDLYVANVGHNCLYTNNGDETFTKVTTGSPVTDSGPSMGCSWNDYNNDGWLDLFVANADGQNNSLYTNDGDGTFTKATSGDIVTNGGNSVTPSWSDYDNDGNMDLFVANKGGQNNFLYQNNGDGTFTKITSGSIVTDGGASWSVSWGDYDNDHDLDLFVANNNEANFLYRNNGNGTFAKITSGEIVTDIYHTRSSGWADCENDGDLDLFTTNKDEKDILYANNGDGTFSSVEFEITDARGMAWADVNRDGDLDLFIAINGTDNLLYHYTKSNSNHWFNLKCIDLTSNFSAVGARVKVKANIGGVSTWQIREISAQTGFGGQGSPSCEFGLKDAATIDILQIQWPNGTVWDTTNVAANQFQERTTDVATKERGNLPETFCLLQNYPNPFNPATSIVFAIPKSSHVTLKLFDMLGREVTTLVDEEKQAGEYRVVFDSENLPSGIYFYQIRSGEFTQMKKLMLLK